MPRFTPIIFAINAVARRLDAHLDAYADRRDFNPAVVVTTLPLPTPTGQRIGFDGGTPLWKVVAEAHHAASASAPFDPLLFVDAEARPVNVFTCMRAMWALRRDKAVIVEPTVAAGYRASMTLGDVAFPADRPFAPCAIVVDGELAGNLVEDSVRLLDQRPSDAAMAETAALAAAWLSVDPGMVGWLRVSAEDSDPLAIRSPALARRRPICSHMSWPKP